MDRYLSEHDAADYLNVSHDYLCLLLSEGRIPFCGIAPYRLLTVGDVTTYEAKRDAEREENLRELARLTEEASGYPDLENGET